VTVIAAGFDGGMPKRREQAMNSARPQTPQAPQTSRPSNEGSYSAPMQQTGTTPQTPPAGGQSPTAPASNGQSGSGQATGQSTGQPSAGQGSGGQAGAGHGQAGSSNGGQFATQAVPPTRTDDTAPVPAPTEGRPGAGTTNSARPQPGSDPVRAVPQTPQPAPHTPASPTSQHSWPVNGPSTSSGTSSPTPSQSTPPRPVRKPDPAEDDLDIPDFLK
jgi:cell division protein FtsZ